MTKYILTIDGGGIRGIIPAYILSKIEKKINKPLSQVFDLMSGTSVGAIIVAALSLYDTEKKLIYSSEDIKKFLFNYGPVIFKKQPLRRIISLFSGPRYSSKVSETALEKLFKNALFGKLGKHVLIPSYDLSSQEAYIFKSWVSEFENTKVTDILLATTAAPAYFSPKKIKSTKKEHTFIDGGIVANNPSVCAYAAAKILFPNEDLCFLSIGCGKIKQAEPAENYKCYGGINWLKSIVPIIFDAGIEVVNYQMKRIIENYKYFRIFSTLDYASSSLDDASSENLKNLELDAKKMAEEHAGKIEEFCQLVINDKKFSNSCITKKI